MSRVGKHVTQHWDLENIIDIVYEHGGIIKDISNHLGVSRRTFYEYKDINPEIDEACKKADGHLDRHTVETAYNVVDKVLDHVEQDCSIAFKAADLVLKKSKKSRYYEEKNKEADLSTQLTPAERALFSRLVEEERVRNSKKDDE